MKKILISILAVLILSLAAWFFFMRQDDIDELVGVIDNDFGFSDEGGNNTPIDNDFGNSNDILEGGFDDVEESDVEDVVDFGVTESVSSDGGVLYRETVFQGNVTDNSNNTSNNDYVPVDNAYKTLFNTEASNNTVSNTYNVDKKDPNLAIFNGNIPTKEANEAYLRSLYFMLLMSDDVITSTNTDSESVVSSTTSNDVNNTNNNSISTEFINNTEPVISNDTTTNNSNNSRNTSSSSDSGFDINQLLDPSAPTDQMVSLIKGSVLYNSPLVKAHVYLYESVDGLVGGLLGFGDDSGDDSSGLGIAAGLIGGAALLGGGGDEATGAATTAANTPFGGTVLSTVVCTCTANTLVYVQDLRTSSMLSLIYQPGATTLYEYYNVFSSGASILGTYTPGAGQCQIYSGNSCTSLSSTGMMNSTPGVGTSAS